MPRSSKGKALNKLHLFYTAPKSLDRIYSTNLVDLFPDNNGGIPMGRIDYIEYRIINLRLIVTGKHK